MTVFARQSSVSWSVLCNGRGAALWCAAGVIAGGLLLHPLLAQASSFLDAPSATDDARAASGPVGFDAAATFDAAAMLDWRAHSFAGETRYESVSLEGQPAVHARCDNSASGLFLDQRVDLDATPILEWRWRVERVFPTDAGVSERDKAGDDFPARVYVVREGVLSWRTRAINYVWASGEPVGAEWPNPYASQARMLVLQTGPVTTAREQALDDGPWRVERRNVRDDFQRLHGRPLDRVDAVAIMTDCDDRSTTIDAFYGGLRWLAQ